MRSEMKQAVQQAAVKAHLWPGDRFQRGMSLGRDIKNALPEQPSVIFDVGAHYGESLRDLTRWFPDAVVHCFEPGSEAFSRLLERVGSNPRVICSNMALSEEAGTGTIYVRRESENTSLTDYCGQHEYEVVVRTEVTTVDSIDNYVSVHGIERIDLLKADTEGLDLKVLLGGRAMFDRQAVGMVRVEASMSPENTKHVAYQEFDKFFGEYNYRLFGIYDQVSEWPTGRPFLRRCDLVFISPDLARV